MLRMKQLHVLSEPVDNRKEDRSEEITEFQLTLLKLLTMCYLNWLPLLEKDGKRERERERERETYTTPTYSNST